MSISTGRSILVTVPLLIFSALASASEKREEVTPLAPLEEEIVEEIELPDIEYEEWVTPVPVRPRYQFVEPRFTIRHDVGDGVGYNRGFTYLEGFAPIWQRKGLDVFYSDVRVVNFDDNQFWEFNAGGGYRYYDCASNRIHGVNLFYDGRNTDFNFYHQIGIGLESLGRWVDFRVNGYLPVGEDSTFVGFSNLQFRGFQLLAERNFEGAMRGVDVEVGVPIPGLERFNAKAFAGYYHYSNEDFTDEANGVSGRLEAQLSEAMSLHFSVQHDDVFDTTVNGGLAVHFGRGQWWKRYGLGRADRCEECIHRRLNERVVRDPNIVIHQEGVNEPLLDPNTGRPYHFLHVAAGGNSDGSFEDPYATLAQAVADPRFAQGNVVVFDRTTGTFTGDVKFAPNTQLLSSSPMQILPTVQLGNIVVPLSGTGGPLPKINGHLVMTPLGVVSGFNINGQGRAAAIQVIGHGRFRIANNVITNIDAGLSNRFTLPDGRQVEDIAEMGIFASGFSGRLDIANNSVTVPGTALFLAPVGTEINVTTNNFTSTADNGLDLQTFGNANVVANFRDSSFAGGGEGDGIDGIQTFNSSTLTANFHNCTATGGTGINSEGIDDVESYDNSTLIANFTNCTVKGGTGPGGPPGRDEEGPPDQRDGIDDIESHDTSRLTFNFQGGSISGTDGVDSIQSFDNSTLSATFRSTTIKGTEDGVDDILSYDNSRLTATFLGTAIRGMDSQGFEDIESYDNSHLTFQCTACTINGGFQAISDLRTYDNSWLTANFNNTTFHAQFGSGIDDIVSEDTSRLSVTCTNCSITGGPGDSGINDIESFDTSTLTATFTGSTIRSGNGFGDEGIEDIESHDTSMLHLNLMNNTITGVDARALVAQSSDTSTLCLNAMGNTLNSGLAFSDFDLTHIAGSTFRVVDFPNLGGNNNGATVATTGVFTNVPFCP